MATINVAETIEETVDLFDEKERIAGEIAENRTLLRGAVRNKKVTAEQAKWIGENFPEQEKKTPAQRVKEAQERVKELEKKAAEAAAKDGKA